MNVDQLLAIVDDLSLFTTMEQLEERRSQCQTAYDQLRESEVTFDPSGKAEPEKATMLLAAIAKIPNKIAAMRFSERQKAQRAIKAAATVPQERTSTGGVRAHP